MKYIMKHKTTSVIVLIFIIAVIGLFFAYRVFFINSSSPKYGNRLDGIEEVKITNDDIKVLEASIKENKNVTGVTTNISGRTLKITITVKDNLSLKDAKTIGNGSYSKLKKEQISYYAIQIFVNKKDPAQNNFPIIGYKQKETTNVVWTKDRAVTKTDETK